MTLGTILYILLFLASCAISVLFLQYGAVALMGLLITVPIFMLFFLILMRKSIHVSVDSKNPLAEKDDIDKPARAVITLSIENRSRFLPLTKQKVRVIMTI